MIKALEFGNGDFSMPLCFSRNEKPFFISTLWRDLRLLINIAFYIEGHLN